MFGARDVHSIRIRVCSAVDIIANISDVLAYMVNVQLHVTAVHVHIVKHIYYAVR